MTTDPTFTVDIFKVAETHRHEDTVLAFFQLPFACFEDSETKTKNKTYIERKNSLLTMLSSFLLRYPEAKTKKLLFLDAMVFAHSRHFHFKQTRQFDDSCVLDYIFHPIEVMVDLYTVLSAMDVSLEVADAAMAASVLHDVVEDTVIPRFYNEMYAYLAETFSPSVANTVKALTNEPSINAYKIYGVEYMEELTTLRSRRQRKIIDAERLRVSHFIAQVIKLLDIQANVRTVYLLNPSFQRLYCNELLETIEVLDKLHFDEDVENIKTAVKFKIQQHKATLTNLPEPNVGEC